MVEASGERGFSLIELMVSMAIFLIIVASVLGIYISANKYITFMEAKSQILNSVSNIYNIYRPYFYGASKIYDPQHIYLGDIFTSANTATFSSIEFFSRVKQVGDDGSEQYVDAWVLVTSTQTGFYVKKKVDGHTICVPEKRVVIYRKIADTTFGSDISETDPPDMNKWRDWLRNGEVKRQVISPNIGGINGLSELLIKYDPYSVNLSGFDIKWRKIHVVITVGVREEVYSDSECTQLYHKYPVSLYPYTVVLSLTSVNR